MLCFLNSPKHARSLFYRAKKCYRVTAVCCPRYVPMTDLYSRLNAHGCGSFMSFAIASTRAGSPMMIARSVPIACVSCVCGCGDSPFRTKSLRPPPYTTPIISMTDQTLHQHHCTTETGRRQDKMHCSRCRFMQKKNCCCQVRKSALYFRHRCIRCLRIS